ncbi:hypothetical protein OG455_34665 [Kitasatospora sp. NBC_01287]|nr:hypothetical protein [Kitasatospora sp. NBC_01287]MCX4750593.1 hypothetical protein [Kitasatospora sp. NBC_01287]
MAESDPPKGGEEGAPDPKWIRLTIAILAAVTAVAECIQHLH